MKQFDEALQHYERAAVLQPGNSLAHCNMGVIYKEKGELENAIAAYERALALSPNCHIAKVCCYRINSSHSDVSTLFFKLH